MKKCLFIVFFIMQSLILAVYSLACESYTITNLGHLGANRSHAYGINNSGVVVGQSYTTYLNMPPRHAFIWQDGIMTDLGTIEGLLSSTAYDVNDHNVAIGVAVGGAGGIENTPVQWEKNQILELIIPAGLAGEAIAINNAGIIVGFTIDANSIPSVDQAVIWKNGHMAELPTSTKSYFSRAVGLNESGKIVGFEIVKKNINDPEQGEYRAVMWKDGNLIDLGIPDSIANDINNHGVVVGQRIEYHEDGTSSNHAFLYKDGETVSLRIPNEKNSQAMAINNLGQVVGYSSDENYDSHAVLWQNDTFYYLDDLIPEDSQWDYLFWAHDINDNGQIVGEGIPLGKTNEYAFIMNPVSTSINIDIMPKKKPK
jgi:probable HAF family extracellular repeat protein